MSEVKLQGADVEGTGIQGLEYVLEEVVLDEEHLILVGALLYQV